MTCLGVMTEYVCCRRETRPKILWNTGSKLNSEKEKDSGAAAQPAAVVTETAASAAKVVGATAVAAVVGEKGALWTVTEGDLPLSEVRCTCTFAVQFYDPF